MQPKPSATTSHGFEAERLPLPLAMILFGVGRGAAATGVSDSSKNGVIAVEMDYLCAVIEQRKLIDNMNRARISCLAEDYKANKISDEEFDVQMRDLTREQNKLFNGDMTIHSQYDRVLSEIDDIVVKAGKDERRMDISLSTYFYNLLHGKPPGRAAGQIQRRKDLYKHYHDQPILHGLVWCPITKCFGPYKSRRAAHLVTYKVGYKTMGELFDDEGYKLMWSMGNGLPMERTFEEAFDDYEFCLLPREVTGKLDEWQLVLMNESLREEFIYAGNKWDEYDGTFLQFWEGCDARQQKRLYFHYWMCLIKAQRELTPGWQNLRKKTKMGRLWLTPGAYLRKAIVKKLGAFIGDHLPPEQEAIIKNSFEGSKVPDDREDISVQDILSVLILRSGPNDDGDNVNQDD
ncbi:hypothetical protein BDZ45DRAFT_791166 [Acephala macrosclerotiorum]|nr:hypothetical protein BDZ45DRAFT_791166 [Acephala macrosclerotiorum]